MYAAVPKAPAEAAIDAGGPHSMRSILRDWAGEIGFVQRETAEAVPARRAAMEGYARWLTRLGVASTGPR